eukprot:gb/GFBE01057073.1/.p1 GENE.gb/GFBE01057073.1/~~gb/GFBE01057073.1/.p1  ORF type:complete len:344 (+),score=67.54 gb/GFBE01057073.1/:1-1032(+)
MVTDASPALEKAETALYHILLFAAFTAVGLTLNGSELVSIWQTPLLAQKSPSRALVLGMVGLYLCLPLVAGVIIAVMQAPVELATGLMMVAIMPGGPASAIYSVVVGGFTGLNITMTLVSSALAAATVPLLFKVAVASHEDAQIQVNFFYMMLTSAAVIIPLALGGWLSYRAPSLRRIMEKVLAPVVIILVAVVFISKAGSAVTLERIICAGILALGGWAVGSLIGLVGGLGFRSSVSLSLELVIRDMPMAMAIINNSFSENAELRDSVMHTALVCGMMAHIVSLAAVGTCAALQRCGWIPAKIDDSASKQDRETTQEASQPEQTESSSLDEAQASSPSYGSA